MRRTLVSAAAVLVAVGAVGCSAQTASSECDDAVAPGALTDSVRVQGEESPQITVPDDITANSTQRTAVIAADDRSRVATDDDLVSVNVVFVDSVTGDELYRSADFGTDRGSDFIAIDPEAGLPMLVDGIRCAAPGDRLVVAGSAEESLPMAMSYGLTPGASLVALIDVVDVRSMAAEGTSRALPNGFPAIATDAAGRPGVVLPPLSAPTSTRSAVSIQGDGREVDAEDTIIANVLTVGWDGTEEQNTWPTGPVSLGTESQMDQSGVTFRGQLTGAKIGSRVVVIEAQESGARVHVVDIISAG